MLYLLLIFYFLVIIIFGIFTVLSYYHLWRYGYKGDITKMIMVGYALIMGAIIVFSILIILTLDWKTVQFNFPNINIF